MADFAFQLVSDEDNCKNFRIDPLEDLNTFSMSQLKAFEVID
jgi:hypothetical protein